MSKRHTRKDFFFLDEEDHEQQPDNNPDIEPEGDDEEEVSDIVIIVQEILMYCHPQYKVPMSEILGRVYAAGYRDYDERDVQYALNTLFDQGMIERFPAWHFLIFGQPDRYRYIPQD